MSSFPYVRAAVSKAACTSASFPTSHRQNAASPPSLTMAFATSCPLASSLSAKTIRAPSAAKRRTAAAPMPLAAPVMMAVFPCSFMALSLFVAVSGKFFPYTRSDIPDKRGSKTKIRRKAPTAWSPVPSTGGRGVSARRCRNIFSIKKMDWQSGQRPNAVIGNGISLWPSLSSYGKTSFPIRCCANVTQSPAEPHRRLLRGSPGWIKQQERFSPDRPGVREKQYG